MSITLGIYDLFSYLIPGVLYLYVINETLRLFKVDPTSLMPPMPEGVLYILGLVLAFVTGHIFDLVARWLVFRLIFRDKTSQTVLETIQRRDVDANLQFVAKDWHLLLVLLRQRNFEVAQSFDKHEADSIMFRNISLIGLAMALILGYRALTENPWLWIAAAIAALVFVMAARRSRTLHTWFFEGIFLAALEYGNSVGKVIENQEKQDLEHLVRISLSRKNAKGD